MFEAFLRNVVDAGGGTGVASHAPTKVVEALA